MVLDVILCILCIIAFVRGWKKGLLWAICSLLAILIGIIISLKLSHALADFLFEKNILTGQYTLLLSFVILFLGSIFLFRVLIKFIENILDTFFLGWINNLLGGLLYSFFIVFLFSTFYWLADSGHLLKAELKSESRTYPFVAPIAPKTIEVTTHYLPFFKGLYGDIKNYSQKLENDRKASK